MSWRQCELMMLKKFAYFSAAVYGEPKIIPTPEDVPLIQNSLYGASKISGKLYVRRFHLLWYAKLPL